MGITILAGNVVINKWGYSLLETGIKSNVAIGNSSNNGFDNCASSTDGTDDTDTITFDVHVLPVCDPDPQCAIEQKYDALVNMVRLANNGSGHLQYRWMGDSCVRIWEIVSGSIGQKDMQNRYARKPFITADLQLTVRKSIPPMVQLFPTRATKAHTSSVATFLSLWGGTVSAVLVRPDSTAFTEAAGASVLSDITALHEITNTGYARLVLSGKATVASNLWPFQPIGALLPRIQHASDRVAVACSDLVWTSIAAGNSIGGILLIDGSNNILGWIPYTSWAYGDTYHPSVIVPDGGTVKFKVNQLGLLIAP